MAFTGSPWSGAPPSPGEPPAAAARWDDLVESLRAGAVPAAIRRRLEGARAARLPWTATLTPAELLIAQRHGLRPIAAVSATCWLYYGWSWTEGHRQGWEAALRRLREEAKAAGANAVLDVKMRTVRLPVADSMDFTLIGTAVAVEGLPASPEPVIATVPALEFVKLIEADVVPSGIAVGTAYDVLMDLWGATQLALMGNVESTLLSQFWERLRRRAQAALRASAAGQGNGVLAHVNFSEMRVLPGDDNQPKRYLGRHIVVATTVDARRGDPLPHDIGMVVDMCAGATKLTGRRAHHQSYASDDREGAI